MNKFVKSCNTDKVKSYRLFLLKQQKVEGSTGYIWSMHTYIVKPLNSKRKQPKNGEMGVQIKF